MLRAALRMSTAMALGSGSGLAYATQVEPRWLATERIRVALPNLPPAFEGYRLAQISDLHMGESVPLGLIRAGVKRALELAPDAIVLTGDYVTAWLDGPALVAELARLTAPDGVWAVLGNHDHWVDPSGVRDALAEAGVRELRNAHTAIERDGERLILAGVQCCWPTSPTTPTRCTRTGGSGCNFRATATAGRCAFP
jgi:predicted MPP superfamily phosphohydrolase